MHGPDSRPPDKTGGGFALEPQSTGTHFTIETMICTLSAWVLVLLVFPVLLLLWATESRSARIRRLHKNGHTYVEIAKRYRVSPATVSRWAKA